MERELAALSLDDEEDEIVEVQRQVELAVNENEFWLGLDIRFRRKNIPVSIFSQYGFGAGYYEASRMFNNHLLVFHRLFLREDPLKMCLDVRRLLRRKKKLMFATGNCACVYYKFELLTLFCFFCGQSGHNDSFSQARMALGVEVGVRVKGGNYGRWSSGRWSWATEEKMDNGIRIDPILGLNLEGNQTIMSLHKNDPSKPLGLMAMKHDLEKLILEGWDGKKRPRRDLSEYSQGVEFRSLGTTDGKVLEIFLYRQLPRGMPTGRNENDKLKCLRVGEPSSYVKTSVYAEVA
ncbi:hypothetical protein Gotur_006037 [Gossypium turneri]